jgi:hypothetical protein
MDVQSRPKKSIKESKIQEHRETGGWMSKTWFFLLAAIIIPVFAFCAEDKSVWKDGKLYEGQEYGKLAAEEKDKVKQKAEEFAMALLLKDEEDLMELAYHDGFPSEKKEKILYRIASYHNQEGFACTNIEVITVKLKDDLKEAMVGVKVHFSTVDTKGGLSTAPISIQTWKFINKYGEWYYTFDK